MDVGGKLHAPAAVSLGEKPVPTEQEEALWASETARTVRRKEIPPSTTQFATPHRPACGPVAVLTALARLFVLCEESLNIKFTLQQAMKAQRGSRGIALLFLPHLQWMGVCGQRPVPAALPPRTRAGSNCTGTRLAQSPN